MPIPIKDYENLKSKRLKSNTELLLFMDKTQAYTTTDIEKFLGIRHPATLQRLKRLKEKGYIEVKTQGKAYYWIKIKDWEPELNAGEPEDWLEKNKRHD